MYYTNSCHILASVIFYRLDFFEYLIVKNILDFRNNSYACRSNRFNLIPKNNFIIGLMKYSISIPLVLSVAISPLALIPSINSALTPIQSTTATTEAFLTRRSAAFSLLNCIFTVPSLAHAVDEPESTAAAQKDNSYLKVESEAAKVDATKERMRQRIAESKKNYRKPTDLVKERRETTDYSCVSDTGSPCLKKLESK